MDTIVNIKPFDQVKITTVSGMTVRVMRLELFKSATLHVSLLDANGNGFDSKVVEINGDDYKMWGGDDTFIYGFVARKLGFSMPDVDPPTPALAPPALAPPALAPVVEAPVETPLVETPVVETPLVETPVVETPVVETPVEVTPAEEAPVSTSE